MLGKKKPVPVNDADEVIAPFRVRNAEVLRRIEEARRGTETPETAAPTLLGEAPTA